MMFKTHFLFALFISLITFNYFNLNPFYYVLILVFSGILPDIDHSKSWIGKKLNLFSWLINFIFGHRKFIHSIIFSSLIAILIRMFFNDYWIPFYLGFISHLILDSLTKQGIYPFYPSNFKIHGLVKTNGLIEKLFLGFLVAVNVIYIFKFLRFF